MNLHTELPVILILFSPLLAAIISLTGKLFPPRYSLVPAFLVWLGGSLAALAAAFPSIAAGTVLQYSLGGWAEPLGISLEVNGVTWIASLTDVIIASAAWLCTLRQDKFNALFYFFFFMALFSLQGVLCTRDIFNLFVWFEVLSLSSFVLISYDRSLTSRLAAIRYLLISSMSILFFLIGVWILYRLFGVLSLKDIAVQAQQLNADGIHSHNRPAMGLAIALITAGILTRAAVVPFHTWLPDAHMAAPYQVSALLSGFVIKAPMLALWRISAFLDFPLLLESLIWVGGVCALWGVIAAMVQKDAKKLLGYHSVSQMGYIVAAFGAGGADGRSAAIFYIIAHALFKSLLFLTVGHVTSSLGTRNVYTLRGAARLFPGTTILFFIAAASISGIPLFAGFAGKILVAKSLYGHPAYVLLLLAGIGTAASFIKLSRIFFGKPSAAALKDPLTVSGYIGMGLLASGCLLLGLFPHSFHQTILSLIGNTSIHISDVLTGWYSPYNLVKAGISIGAGFLVSQVLVSKPGRALSLRIRDLSVGLDGSLRLLTAGFILVILYGAAFY